MTALSEAQFVGSGKGALEYATALDGLSRSQASATLTALGLSKEDQKLVLAQMELISTAKSYTIESLSSAIGIKAETLAKAANASTTDTLTAAMLKNILSGKVLDAAQKNLLKNTLEQTAANNAGATSFNTLGASMKSAFSSMMMTPMGWISALMMIIPIITSIISKISEMKEEAIEAANEIIDAYDSANDTYASNIESLENLRSSFESLSTGVNENGENVSLTADEYAEYLDIIDQIADISPDIIKGYDSEGKAVLDYKSALDDAIESQETYLENERNIYLGGGEDLFKGKTAEWEDAASDLKGAYADVVSAIDPDRFKVGGIAGAKTDTYNDILSELGIDQTGQSYAEYLAEIYENYEKIIDLMRLSGQYTETELSNIRTTFQGMASAYSAMGTAADSQTEYLEEWSKDQSWYGDIPIDAIDEFASGLENVNDPLKSYNENIAAAQEYGQDFSDALSSASAQNIIELSKGLADGSVTMEEYNAAVQAFKDSWTGNEDVLDAVILFFGSLSNVTTETEEALDSLTVELSTVLEALAGLETGVGSITDALDEFAENGIVSAGTLSDLYETFGEQESFNDFVNILSDTSSTMEEVQSACDKLAAEYINSSGILDDLTEENAALIAAQLEQIGVTNAQEIVQRRLAVAEYEAWLKTQGLTSSTIDSVNAFLAETGATYDTVTALQQFYSQIYQAEVASSNFADQTQETVSALLGMANAAGIAGKAIQYLEQAQHYMSLFDIEGEDIYYEMAEKYFNLAKKYSESIEEASIYPTVTVPQTYSGSSSSSSSSSAVEAYIADIEAYREALKRLAETEQEVDRIETALNYADTTKEKISLTEDLIQAYGAEQEALHTLNEERRATINQNVSRLQGLGFDVTYDAATNELWIANMEHINDLAATSKGEYDSLQEATNAYREEIEDLISATEELNEDNQDASSTWWDLRQSIKDAKNEVKDYYASLVSEASEVVDSIQSVHTTLKEAAKEYQENGYITVDTFQAILDLGVEYLGYLYDENGQLSLNAEAIRNVIAARTKQLATEQAYALVQQAVSAAQTGEMDTLQALIGVTDDYNYAIWDMMEEQIASAGLSADITQALYDKLAQLKNLAESSVSSIWLEDLAEAATDASDKLDTIQSVYDAFMSAAEEYQSSGFITVDTLQTIIGLGPKYMAYLQDENGQLVLNEEAIKNVVAAYTEQMAIENAMLYVEQIWEALRSNNIEQLNNLVYALDSATDSTWGFVYANLALAKSVYGDLFSDSAYAQAVANLEALQALTLTSISSIGEETGSLSESVNDLLDYTMDMLKQRIEDQIDALEDLKDAY